MILSTLLIGRTYGDSFRSHPHILLAEGTRSFEIMADNVPAAVEKKVESCGGSIRIHVTGRDLATGWETTEVAMVVFFLRARESERRFLSVLTLGAKCPKGLRQVIGGGCEEWFFVKDLHGQRARSSSHPR